MKHKCPSPRIGKKPRGNIGRWLYAAFLTATLSASLCQPASAATVWEKANEIMRDVYTQILGISTIAAIVTVIKKPFTAPDGEIDYHKEIVKKMPDPPKRKDRM